MSKWLKDIKNKQAVDFDKLDHLVLKDVNADGREITPLPPPKNWEQTDSVMIETDGYWWIHSKVDKRWRAEGKGIVGGLSMCKEAKYKFEEMKKSFGKIPWDLTYRMEPRNLKKFKLAKDVKIDDYSKFENLLEKKI
jgi:hypothetical protein